MSLIQIYEGWRNKLLPKKELKKLIADAVNLRMEICDGCEFHSKNKVNVLRPDAHCIDCGCTLSAKTACLSCQCPQNKWMPVMTQVQETEMDNEAGDV